MTAVLDTAATAVVFRAARQDKPWGHEVIFAAGEAGYVGKVIHVTAGQALSLQYHEQKVETISMEVVDGRLLLPPCTLGLGVTFFRILR